MEGHPDNAAACWLGGFVTAACEGRRVHVARVAPPAEWRAIVVLPAEPLATSEARAALPATYSRADAVANIQSVALLGLAFAQNRPDLLRMATIIEGVFDANRPQAGLTFLVAGGEPPISLIPWSEVNSGSGWSRRSELASWCA